MFFFFFLFFFIHPRTDRFIPIDSVLNQRIHYSAVDLTEKFSGMLVTFADYNKSVIVQDITVQCVGGAIFLATRTATLKEKWKLLLSNV